jgi:hypothetical protein
MSVAVERRDRRIDRVAMILPERTVDAWTAAYITGRRWRARLWAPTERFPGEGYDLGVGLGNVGGIPAAPHRELWPDKVFVFEHKGVDELRPGHSVIWIRIRQLLDHLAADRALGGGLVYYLLPNPEWRSRKAAPYGTVPDVSWRRTRGPTLPPTDKPAWDGFQLWAQVAHVEDLLQLIQVIFRADPHRFKPRPPRGGGSPDWACALEMTDVSLIQNLVPLRDFISGVRRCTHGRLAGDLMLGKPQLAEPESAASRLGPSLVSLGDALGAAEVPGLELAEEEVRNVDEPRAEAGGDQAAVGDADSEVFDRPAFMTFYGVGDSKRRWD